MLMLATSGAIGQTQVTIAPVWVAYDTATHQASGYQWHLDQNDPGTITDDSGTVKLNGNPIYVGKNQVMEGSADTTAMFYFTANSIHPCKDTAGSGSVHWMDFYDGGNIAVFKTNGWDLPCQSLNNLMRKYVWAELGHPIPSSWWGQWQNPADTTDTTGGNPTDTTMGIDSQAPKGLEVWPNPATDYLNVHVTEAGEFTIVDMSGRTVFAAPVRNGKNIVSVSTLRKGMYIAEMGNHRSRIIKQ